jgi:hypothetical protein
MKHIIIEGGDRLGKSTLIEGIAKHFNYDNITIRHFGKPPKEFPEEHTPLSFQTECFYKEGDLLERIGQLEDDVFGYYENIIIWNRAHLGEYVYGQMFRSTDPEQTENMILNFEERFLISNPETYLILLTADPEFFLSKEDGKSFSKNIDQKTTEIRLFDEIFEKSILDNKIRIKVNNGNEFFTKDFVLKQVLDFIKNK